MAHHHGFVEKGVEIVRAAVAKDDAGDYDGALADYVLGVEHLLTGMKYERNAKIRAMVHDKAAQYLDRAEQLKAARAKAVAPAKNTTKDPLEDDKEMARYKAALSSAIVKEKPNVHWDDVAGLETAKALLQEVVILPLRYPRLFTGKRKPWQGILLFGPPGTGKSFLGKAVATEAASTFFSISSSDLVSKYVGESERMVKSLFEMARAARPSIIFIDEIDSLCCARTDDDSDHTRRLKTELLVQMQGVGHSNEGVLVLGATNTPWDLDPAVRRRFEKRVYIPLPDARARTVMFKLHLGSTTHNLTEDDFRRLGDLSEGLSGSDIAGVVRDAIMQPIRTLLVATHFKKVPDPEHKYPFLWCPCSPADPAAVEMPLFSIPNDRLNCQDVTVDDVLRSCLQAKSSVGAADIDRHMRWAQEFGEDG
ncbi:Vesicle-fusing ATPase [Plasmodiophora brassicae]